jgi:hypothetical protein
MKTETRDELTDVLRELSRRVPDWRMGQLVANVAGWADRDVWDVEDAELLVAARAYLESAAAPATATHAER